MRETRALGWRGVTCCFCVLVYVRFFHISRACRSIEFPVLVMGWAITRVRHTCPLLRPTAMPDLCLTSLTMIAVPDVSIRCVDTDLVKGKIKEKRFFGVGWSWLAKSLAGRRRSATHGCAHSAFLWLM